MGVVVQVDDQADQEFSEILEAARELDGTLVYGFTMPGAAYADTEISVAATVELTNGYIIDNICEYNGAVWAEIDGTVLEADDRGSGSECYYRFTY